MVLKHGNGTFPHRRETQMTCVFSQSSSLKKEGSSQNNNSLVEILISLLHVLQIILQLLIVIHILNIAPKGLHHLPQIEAQLFIDELLVIIRILSHPQYNVGPIHLYNKNQAVLLITLMPFARLNNKKLRALHDKTRNMLLIYFFKCVTINYC